MDKKLFRKIEKKIIPSYKEEQESKDLQKEIIEYLFDNYTNLFGFKPMFCGSIKKGTWISGQKDLDLFLLFNPNLSKNKLREYGLTVGKKLAKDFKGNYKIKYAEHPYVRAIVNGHYVDIVPAYDISPQKIKSSVDRTPHHVRYVKDSLDRILQNETRFLKQFCKGIGVYGSNLRTEGFSGYLCEILILYYGSFENVLKSSLEWKPGQVIDIEKHYKKLDKKFNQDIMRVIDPIDKNRNVASVLSTENFFLFKKMAREFLNNPSEKFFFPEEDRPIGLEELENKIKERNTNFILIKFQTPNIIEDIFWPQFNKTKKRLVRLLRTHEFEVLRSGLWSDLENSVIILEMEVSELPNIRKRFGPKITDLDNSAKFHARYEGKKFYIEDSRWVVEHSRRFKNAVDLLREFLQSKEKELRVKGVSKDIAKEMDKNVEIADGKDVFRIFRRYYGLRRFMKKYFEKNLV